MTDVPDDITMIIFSNLLVKSLLRLKCVSKQWRLCISNQRRGGAIIRLNSTCSSMWSLRPSFCSINQQLTSESLNYTFWERCNMRIESCMILGSCHGLIAISINLDIFLWNPVTRFCTKVLELPGVYWNDNYIRYGELCFDSSKNDYKLVMFPNHVLQPPKFNHKFVLVASLKDKKWRRIHLSDHDILSARDGITFQGRLHYRIRVTKLPYCYENDENYNKLEFLPQSKRKKLDHLGPRYDVTCFDPIYEKFLMFSVPNPNSLQEENIIVGLGVLNEYLCMTRLEYDDETTNVEVLIMKEYGVKDSWTSLFIIRNLKIDPSFGVVVPFSITKNGELVLIMDGHRVIAYNPKNDNTKDVLNPKVIISAITYVKSLISPKEEYSWNAHIYHKPDTRKLFGERDLQGKRFLWY